MVSGDSILNRMGAVFLFGGRIALGAGLGLAATVFSIVVAWGLFIFSGSQSLTIWLASLMFSAGLGAGAGTLLAWMQVDRRNNPRRFLTTTLVVIAGTLGAWLGYAYGSNREFECCAMVATSPVYYTALGATLGANITAITISLIREYHGRRISAVIKHGIT